MKLFMVVGTRPNLIKLAPLVHTLQKSDIQYEIIHTGQHYDLNMSDAFFEELDIPVPNLNFGIGSTSLSALGLMMQKFTDYLIDRSPNFVIVFGDVDSTRSVAVATARLCRPNIKLVHVESGMRSGERIPEEMNRKITDVISDIRFCNTEWEFENCKKEGMAFNTFISGNIMIEQLYSSLQKIYKVKPDYEDYVLVTLHRNYNVDDPKRLQIILSQLNEVAGKKDVVFPIHPRTYSRIKYFSLTDYLENLDVVDPMGYVNMIAYVREADVLITDSGGLQVESSVLDTPCLTVRKFTSHKYTLHRGTNILVEPEEVAEAIFDESLLEELKSRPKFIDAGKASGKIIEILKEIG